MDAVAKGGSARVGPTLIQARPAPSLTGQTDNQFIDAIAASFQRPHSLTATQSSVPEFPRLPFAEIDQNLQLPGVFEMPH